MPTLGTSGQQDSMASPSISLPDKMIDEIDETVEESAVYESRSHYIRTAVRHLQADEEGEFGASR